MTSPRADANRRTWIVLGAIALVFAIAVVVAVVAAGGSGSDSGGKRGDHAVETASVDVTGTPLPAFPDTGASDKAIGQTIPTLRGSSLFDGTAMTIGPPGKPGIVVFLAHWCPHCRAEVPVIVQLSKAGKLDGVDVQAVATGTSADLPNYPPSSWLEGEDWPYPTMADSTSSTAARAYGLTSYPYMVFVDANGKVVARSEGEVPADVLTTAVRDLAAGRTPSLGISGSRSPAG